MVTATVCGWPRGVLGVAILNVETKPRRNTLRVTRSTYWNESGGGYAVFKLTVAKTGSKPFCRTVTGAHPVS